jgi:pyrimidine deaminase RibD-like protein
MLGAPEVAMAHHVTSRRHVLGSFLLAPVAGASAYAQVTPPALSPIAQPAVASKAAFLARAHALRDAAAAAGDQPYGAVVVRNGVIVGEGRSQVVTLVDPTAHSELMAVRDAARRLGTRTLADCDMYSSATPCPMCQGALYWAGVRRVHTDGTPEEGVAPKLGC